MPLFADVISFFGVASFFAWLAFVVFQNEQLRDYKEVVTAENLRMARRRLFMVYDFFMISFASYAVAYVADFLLHFRNGKLIFGFGTFGLPLLYGIIGSFSLLGLLTLIMPMGYIRSMARGDTSPLTVNPPPISNTVLLFSSGGVNFITALVGLNAILYTQNTFIWNLWRGIWGVILITSAGGFLRSLRDWDAARRTVIFNGFLLFLPIILFSLAEFLLKYCPAPCTYVVLR